MLTSQGYLKAKIDKEMHRLCKSAWQRVKFLISGFKYYPHLPDGKIEASRR